MATDPRKAEVLAALSEIKSENLVQEERARKAQVRKSKVGADLEVEDAQQAEKKGVGSDWCAQTWCVVLETITFTVAWFS